jgi:hypothetical protein
MNGSIDRQLVNSKPERLNGCNGAVGRERLTDGIGRSVQSPNREQAFFSSRGAWTQAAYPSRKFQKRTGTVKQPNRDSAKLPPKFLNEDSQDDDLPGTNVDDERAPPVNMGNSRQSNDGVTQADPQTGRADAKARMPALQFSN